MSTRSKASLLARRKPLATLVAALLGVSPPAAIMATTRTVTSCADDGSAGTLRSIIAAPSTVSGDVVDLGSLSCPGGKITLYAGYPGILIAQNSLTISGPGADYLTIDASGVDPTTYSALYHTGTGTLQVQYLTVSGGTVNRQGDALGGCIYSKSNVTLVNATVKSCGVSSDGGARGGGVWAGGNVTLASSTVTGNTASAPNNASGGGIWANGNVSLHYSTVSGNSVSSTNDVLGGGIRSNGDVYLLGTTVGGNSLTSTATKASGGGISTAGNLTVSSSTIQDNSANSSGPTAVGGAIDVAGHAGLTSSTISGNTASSFGVVCYHPPPPGGYGGFFYPCGGSGSGGGIYAGADFSCSHSTISNNSALSEWGAASGGGLTAKGSAQVLGGSSVIGNYARSNHAYTDTGGGIYAAGGLSLQFSALTGNLLYGRGESQAGLCAAVTGGGAAVNGGLNAAYATISNNQALPVGTGGGLILRGLENSFIASTISGNSTGVHCPGSGYGSYAIQGYSGGISVHSAGAASTTKFYNTTIAFNSALLDPPGVALYGPMSVTLQSTLMAANHGGEFGDDLRVFGPGTVTFNAGDLATPANNLIRISSVAATSLPTDTLIGSCPLLGPLRNNGGLTMTHALQSGSLAIDAGNNSKNLKEDQRGKPGDVLPYPYPRISGPAADIGAYEVQKNDIVFNSAFDGC